MHRITSRETLLTTFHFPPIFTQLFTYAPVELSSLPSMVSVCEYSPVIVATVPRRQTFRSRSLPFAVN